MSGDKDLDLRSEVGPVQQYPHPMGYPQMVLTMNTDTKRMEIFGTCAGDLLLSLDMLETAERMIKEAHRNARRASGIVAAPASALEQLNGR